MVFAILLLIFKYFSKVIPNESRLRFSEIEGISRNRVTHFFSRPSCEKEHRNSNNNGLNSQNENPTRGQNPCKGCLFPEHPHSVTLYPFCYILRSFVRPRSLSRLSLLGLTGLMFSLHRVPIWSRSLSLSDRRRKRRN